MDEDDIVDVKCQLYQVEQELEKFKEEVKLEKGRRPIMHLFFKEEREKDQEMLEELLREIPEVTKERDDLRKNREDMV